MSRPCDNNEAGSRREKPVSRVLVGLRNTPASKYWYARGWATWVILLSRMPIKAPGYDSFGVSICKERLQNLDMINYRVLHAVARTVGIDGGTIPARVQQAGIALDRRRSLLSSGGAMD